MGAVEFLELSAAIDNKGASEVELDVVGTSVVVGRALGNKLVIALL